MITRRALLLVALTLVGATTALVGVRRAHAEGAVCPCAIVIEVDGLEPKDVTPATTPFLWALAHGGGATAPASQFPALQNRSGFSWEAGRSTMTAGTLPATVALLTGAYPDQTGVPADQYAGPQGAVSLLEPDTIRSDTPRAGISNLLDTIEVNNPKSTAAIIGDPGLQGLFGGAGTSWWPGSDTSGGDPGDPHFCQPDTSAVNGSSLPDGSSTPACPADDLDTMNNAASLLTTSDGAKVAFSFIQLAGVGATKRLNGDTDYFAQTGTESAGTNADSAVSQALQDMDNAINQFVQRYAQSEGVNWSNTLLMVVGDHGYELTPTGLRIPDPNAATDTTKDLSDFVTEDSQACNNAQAELVPQGSFATVYYTGTPGCSVTREQVLSKLRKDIHAINDSASQCAPPPNGAGPCVQDVRYVDPADTPTPSKEAMPGDWHLNAPADGTTRVGGDLVVEAAPGWAVGRSVPQPNSDPFDIGNTTVTAPATNPYPGSGGGPRDRAVAAILNGPSTYVIGWPTPNPADPTSSPFYPVADPGAGPYLDQRCPSAPQQVTPTTGVSAVDAANADPANDANAPGHECQPELVDVAPTIAAFMSVQLPSAQLTGRILNEAFKNPLSPYNPPEDTGIVDIQPEPPPPAQDIVVPPPPPPPPPPAGFDFYGLLRDLTATVTDANGCAYPQAKRGAKLDYLKIEGDFGKPLEALTLTFYGRPPAAEARKKKAARSASWRWRNASAAARKKCTAAGARASSARVSTVRRGGRLVLKAVARFKPFTVERGHVVLKLLIPDQFKPDHVGVIVQQARRLKKARKSKAGKPAPNFAGFGPKAGGIYAIRTAARLHTVKGR